MMDQAYKAFLVKVGLSGNILTMNFALLGGLATKGTWFRNLWEFCHHLKLTLDLDPSVHIQFERTGDATIIDKSIQIGIHGKQLEILNRVRHLKKVILLLDIVHCDGSTIILSRLDYNECRSHRTFPTQKPARKDLIFWKGAI